MNLQIVGCTHHTCPVEIREQLAISAGQVPDVLANLRQRFPESENVLLSTCNRLEIYSAADRTDALPTLAALAQFVGEDRRIDPELVSSAFFAHHRRDAIKHLFTVASSLDSMVVGEAQILSQVKQAYQLASEVDSIGQWTHAAFQSALGVAKRIASETSLHHGRVSIPSVAVGDFAKQIFERFDDKFVLVLGAGEMSQETARYLKSEGAHQIHIVNRRRERAEMVAESIGGTARDWDDLDQLLEQADLVVSATGSPEPVVTSQRFAAVADRRFQRPLFVVDLAVPRDFDPAVGEFVGVYLYSIDDLQAACEVNLRARKQELPKAQHIIEEETHRFMLMARQRATVPTIRSLRETVESISQQELQRLRNRLNTVDERDQKEIEQAFRRVVNKLLHSPLESLRETEMHESHDLLSAVRKLFRLRDDKASTDDS